MKSHLFLFVFSLLLLQACMKDEVSPSVLPPEEKPLPDGRLVSVTTKNYAPWHGPPKVDTFFYDPEGRIGRIEKNNHRNIFLHEYDNKGNLSKRTVITAYNAVPDTSLFQFFTYSEEGRLERKVSYLPDGTLQKAYTYKTDEYGRIIEEKVLNTAHTLRYEYIWKDDNMVHQKDYASDGSLMHEWFNEYDHGLNPFCYVKESPELPLSRNNLVTSKLIDYTNLIDIAVNPIQYSYEYQSDNLPVKESTNLGQERIFTYE